MTCVCSSLPSPYREQTIAMPKKRIKWAIKGREVRLRWRLFTRSRCPPRRALKHSQKRTLTCCPPILRTLSRLLTQ